MGIFIASAGRSGSAWLSACFSALGLSVKHDSHGNSRYDVLADTSFLWHQDHFFRNLVDRNTKGSQDTLILLHRDRESIEASVAKLLGERKNWDGVFREWEQLKDRVFHSGITQILRSTYNIKYADLFEPRFASTLKAIMADQGWPGRVQMIDRVLELFQSLNITNTAAERDTIDSYSSQLIRN